MLCAKCQKDKPTPVTFKGKLYCVSCAATVIDAENEKEILAIQIRDKLIELNDELNDATARGVEAAAEKTKLVARIAELDEVMGAKDSVLNQIDKLEADLKECEREN